MAAVTEQDIEAVLEGHSFARILWIEIFLAAGMAFLAVVLLKLFHMQSSEGWALMEDIPWIMPVLTAIHLALALLVIARSKRFVQTHWRAGSINALDVARLGWRSALDRTPAEVALLLVEATTVMQLVAYAALALFGMGIVWVGIATSDILKMPLYWINAASYVYWWFLWLKSFLTPARAVAAFRRQTNGAPSIDVVS
jgi:hypothetical protein